MAAAALSFLKSSTPPFCKEPRNDPTVCRQSESPGGSFASEAYLGERVIASLGRGGIVSVSGRRGGSLHRRQGNMFRPWMADRWSSQSPPKDKCLSWRGATCASVSEGRSGETSSSNPVLESESATSVSDPSEVSAPTTTSASTSESVEDSPPPPPIGGPYRSLALSSVAVAVGLFMMTRVAGAGPDLGSLARSSLPYDEAISNGKPTLVEFYADWCEVCREMARDVYGVEQQYKDKVNFVMLNIDNPKWAPEVAEFGVDGIPHFSFLDGDGNEEGYAVGRLPPRILAENLAALARGESSVPYSNVVNEASSTDRSSAPVQVSPRAHSR